MSQPSMDDLCKVYVKIRTKKQELEKQHEAEVAVLNEKLQIISSTMKDLMVSLGTKSVKTDHGTAYVQEKTRYYPMDWSLFGNWIVANNAVDLLEKRVAQGNMKEWVEANPTNVPPGVQAETELTVTVRKS